MTSGNSIKRLVTYINQNTATQHLVFIYGTSVYVQMRNRANGDVYYAIQNEFATLVEAKAFMSGYISGCTFYAVGTSTNTYMENVDLNGYTVQKYT